MEGGNTRPPLADPTAGNYRNRYRNSKSKPAPDKGIATAGSQAKDMR